MSQLNISKILVFAAVIIALIFIGFFIITLMNISPVETGSAQITAEPNNDADNMDNGENDFTIIKNHEIAAPVPLIDYSPTVVSVKDFDNGFAWCSSLNENFVINRNGKIVFKFSQTDGLEVKSPISKYKTFLYQDADGNVGLMDLQGNVIVDFSAQNTIYHPNINFPTSAYNDCIAVRTSNADSEMIGLMDFKGDWIVRPTAEFDDCIKISDNIYLGVHFDEDYNGDDGTFASAKLMTLDDSVEFEIQGIGIYLYSIKYNTNKPKTYHPNYKNDKFLMVCTIDNVHGVYLFDNKLEPKLIVELAFPDSKYITTRLGNLSNGLFYLYDENAKVGYYDLQGNLKLSGSKSMEEYFMIRYASYPYFVDNFTVKTEGEGSFKITLINKAGKELFEPYFVSSAGKYQDGMLYVDQYHSKDNEVDKFFTDSTGEPIIICDEITRIGNFKNGFATAETDKYACCYIDKEGNVVFSDILNYKEK